MCQAYAEAHGNISNYSKIVCMTFKAKSAKRTVIPLLTHGWKIQNLFTNTNIWELYWILSSQMTKTFKDNCDKNIVQQTSCEPLLPMFKGSVLFRSFCTPMYASQLRWNFRKSSMQSLRVTYNFECRALYKLSWRASVSSHDSSGSMSHSYI